jgi:hypothetical protein
MPILVLKRQFSYSPLGDKVKPIDSDRCSPWAWVPTPFSLRSMLHLYLYAYPVEFPPEGGSPSCI